MSKPDVIINAPITDDNRRRLSADYALHFIEDAPDRDAFLDEVGGDIQAIITDGPRDIDKALMDRLPKLALIAGMAVGVNRFDLAEAEKRGITITNASGTNAASCADLAVGLLLAVVRKILPNDRLMRSAGGDENGPKIFSDTITGKNVGILGLGAIGGAFATRAAAFDMEIAYHNRRQKDVPYTYYPDVPSLAANVRYLMVSCPGGEETHHLVNTEVLEALGPDGVLINIARGSVVDTAALVTALDNGVIAGAGLDVLEGAAADLQALCGMDNVVMTPHLAGNTFEAEQARNELVADILDDFFAGRPVTNKIL